MFYVREIIQQISSVFKIFCTNKCTFLNIINIHIDYLITDSFLIILISIGGFYYYNIDFITISICINFEIK
jgi:hypothetical protein